MCTRLPDVSPAFCPGFSPAWYDRRPRGDRGREPHALWRLPPLAPPGRVGGGVPGRADARHPHRLRALHRAGGACRLDHRRRARVASAVARAHEQPGRRPGPARAAAAGRPGAAAARAARRDRAADQRAHRHGRRARAALGAGETVARARRPPRRARARGREARRAASTSSRRSCTRRWRSTRRCARHGAARPTPSYLCGIAAEVFNRSPHRREVADLAARWASPIVRIARRGHHAAAPGAGHLRLAAGLAQLPRDAATSWPGCSTSTRWRARSTASWSRRSGRCAANAHARRRPPRAVGATA